MAEKKSSQKDRSEYMSQYQRTNITRVSLVLNKKYDSDIIDHLNTKTSKSDYLKKLIRKDIDSDQ